MFQYKIIHHILFTNADFGQNEKKACLLLSLFHCFGKPSEMAELTGVSAVIFNGVLCICKRIRLSNGACQYFRSPHRGDDLNNCFIFYRKVLRKDNA